MDVVVTVGGVAQSIAFPAGAPLALATSIAAAINAENGTKTEIVSVGGAYSIPDTYDSIFIDAAGATTVTASASASVIGGSNGITFDGAAGATDFIAIAGGNNSIFSGSGSTDNIATGDGNDVVFINGSGTVNAGAGANTIISGGSGSVVIYSDGTGDFIETGSGNASINEAGTGGVIVAGNGPDEISDTGIADTIFGGSGALTISGGAQGMYFLSTSANLVLGSTASNGSETINGASGGSETVFGGTSDLVFTNSSSLTYVAAGDGAATISGGTGDDTIIGASGANLTYFGTQGTAELVQGTGSETISAANSEVGSVFVVGANPGSALLVGGSGNDQFEFITGAKVSDSIENFVGTDGGILAGYTQSETATALASATHFDGNTTITLSNGSSLTFVGITALYQTSTDTFSSACFLRGTLIATERGDVAVEDLLQGDHVLTQAGSSPVVWIGRRRIDLRRAPMAAPVRIHAGALGQNIPHRDLLVSPGHCMFLDGHLIPAERLVNGRTITQDPARREIEYLHIELPAHAILWAEGAETESWLDTGNRAMFENASVAHLLANLSAETTPERAWAVNGCAPMITHGPILDAVRERITTYAYPNDNATEFAIETPGPANFIVPAGASAVWLTSNSCRVGADPRRLGAAISAWSVDGATLSLDHPRLAFGFYATETGSDSAWRWSHGRSRIELGHADHPRMLEITVHAVQLPQAA